MSAMRRIEFFYVVFVVDGSMLLLLRPLLLRWSHTRTQPHVYFYCCEYVPGIVLQNRRAAHAIEPTFVRQAARKPQPPIELRVVHFS